MPQGRRHSRATATHRRRCLRRQTRRHLESRCRTSFRAQRHDPRRSASLPASARRAPAPRGRTGDHQPSRTAVSGRRSRRVARDAARIRRAAANVRPAVGPAVPVRAALARRRRTFAAGRRFRAPRSATVDVRVGLPDAVALRDLWRMGCLRGCIRRRATIVGCRHRGNLLGQCIACASATAGERSRTRVGALNANGNGIGHGESNETLADQPRRR